MTSGTPHRGLAAFWDRHAFQIGQADFLWIDVALSAMVRGEWATFERRLAEGLACVAWAEHERISLPHEAIEQSATAFRYERDLISGDDMNAWLECNGLSTEDWMAYLHREEIRRTCTRDLDDILDTFPPPPRQLLTAAMAEGICSRLFNDFERSLSSRAAVVFDVDPSIAQRFGSVPAASATSAAALVRQHAHWLSMRPEAETRARLTRLLEIEDHFARAAEAIASSEDLNDVVAGNGLEWVLVEIDSMTFIQENAAREAVLCVREDRLSLHDVAGMSRGTVTRSAVFLEDMAPAYRERLLSAEAGQVIGPLPTNGRFDVVSVIRRSVPTLDDDRIATRARQVVVDTAMQHASRTHVRRRTGA